MNDSFLPVQALCGGRVDESGSGGCGAGGGGGGCGGGGGGGVGGSGHGPYSLDLSSHGRGRGCGHAQSSYRAEDAVIMAALLARVRHVLFMYILVLVLV